MNCKNCIFVLIGIILLIAEFISASDVIVQSGTLDADTQTLYVSSSSHRVGIKTQSPSEVFSVNGTFAIRNTTGTLGLFQDTSGRVGIGIVSPNYALEINNLAKALNVSGLLYINATSVGIGVSNIGSGAKLEIKSNTNYGLNVSTIASSGTGYGIRAFGEGSYSQPSYGGYFEGAGTAGVVPTYGIYATASGPGINYAGYFANADVYVEKNVSAQGFIDRSRWCDMTGSEALNALRNINGNVNINHTSMPTCTRVSIPRFDSETNLTINEDGRDIGAYISYLTIVDQELLNKVEMLETELCNKDNTYSFC